MSAPVAMQELDGGCLCGDVRYRVRGKPFHITHCHCATCRRAAGAPMVTWFSVLMHELVVLQGAPRRYISSPKATRSFCPRCGTQLFYQLNATQEEIDITVCSLDRPESLKPEDHTWAESRLSWMHCDDGLPQFAQLREEC